MGSRRPDPKPGEIWQSKADPSCCWLVLGPCPNPRWWNLQRVDGDETKSIARETLLAGYRRTDDEARPSSKGPDIYDPSPFLSCPGGFPMRGPELSGRLHRLVRSASLGPCQKSKRGAMLVSDNAFAMAVNAPADGSPCTGNEACRAVCASICTHAEMAALLRALVRPRISPDHQERGHTMGRMHMIHVAVDGHGQPRSKPTPSCITCSRDMLRAGVTAVWLWGAPDESSPSQWRGWSMADFHNETLKNCGLVRTP